MQVQALLREAALLAETLERRKKSKRLFNFYPDEDRPGFPSRDKYGKHLEFFRRGADVFARAFIAAVGAGKTEAALYELSLHLRGWYPCWWEGVRYARPLDVWVCGESEESVRETLQKKWLGNPYDEGTGILPAEWLDFESITRGAQCIDTFKVRREDGTSSLVGFKTYRQGIEKFFGSDKDIVLLDEPAPADIYGQCAARTRNRENARLMFTVAPLKGMTETVALFMQEPHPSRCVITCGWDEVPHLTDEWKRDALAQIPAHQREAASKGIPVVGSGQVYPVDKTHYVIKPFPIPRHFLWLFGLDDGFHNTAVTWFAVDPDADIAYAVSDYQDGGNDLNTGQALDITVHATRILTRNRVLARFQDMPGYGDAANITRNNGKQIVKQYRDAGVNLFLPTSKEVAAGCAAVLTRLESGRLKIFDTCKGLIQDLENYAFDENQKIIKVNDHRPDSLRYGVMAIDAHKAEPAHVTAIEIPEVRFG